MTASGQGRVPRSALVGVFLLALSIVLLQVALTRVFAIMMWHHLTYMVVSIALLGFGAAGSWLTVRRARGGSGEPPLAGWAAGYGVAAVLAYATVRAVPLDSLELWQQKVNLLRLLLVYALVVVPFLLGGLALGAAIAHWVRHVHRVYFTDLIGSAGGGALSVGLLATCGGAATVAWAGALGLLAALLFAWRGGQRRRALAAGLFAAAVAVAGWLSVSGDLAPPFAPGKVLAPFAGDPQLLRLASSTAEVEVGPSRPQPPLIGGDVSGKPRPFGEARLVGQDGTAPTMLFRGAAQVEAFPFLRDSQTASAQIARRARGLAEPSVLVIGVGGGFDVMTALAFGARRVTAVELNGAMVDALVRHFDDYLGGLFRPGAHPWSDRIALVRSEGRSYARRCDDRFDIIQMSGVDSFTALSTGAYTLAESYLYTVEAVQEMYEHLEEGGYINYSRFVISYPKKPRETLRLANIARSALARSGVADPASQLCVLQGVRWASTMIKRGAFTPAEVDALQRFAAENDFVGLLFDPLRAADQPWTPDAAAFARTRAARGALAQFAAEALLPGGEAAAVEAALEPLTAAFAARLGGRPEAERAALTPVWTGVAAERQAHLEAAVDLLFDGLAQPARAAAAGLARARNDYLRLLRGAAAERAAFVRDYDYDLTPCTDDCPFFFNYYRWGSLLPQLLRPTAEAGLHKLYHPDFPVGHAVLLASLLQISALAFALILWPLRRLARAGLGAAGVARTFVYFAALGLGYMFVEIVLMQKMVIFLGHPTYAVAVVLTGLLACSGVGALLSERLRPSPATLRRLGLAVVAAIALTAAAVNYLLPLALGQPLALRVAASLLLLLPLGLALGACFPTGLRAVAQRAPQLVPWCWAVNGFLSVFAAVFCIALGMQVGFTLVLLLAAAAYALGFAALASLARRPAESPA